ncbi:hypothetical protein BDV98DRAFT_618238 [Pterulicium gracile]|uniref:Uncharacterized protein n=1 Tax=Pterulicium gracile TaxID=1884261 RepID=A0A5C3QV42_9AGAR|nr:hypothetical protein BDV98DRAFT_618238 [Pterula gracilis]
MSRVTFLLSSTTTTTIKFRYTPFLSRCKAIVRSAFYAVSLQMSMQAPSAKVTVSHPIELLLERPCGRLCMRTIKLDLNLPANEMVHLAAQLVKTQAQLEYLHIRTGDHHSTGRLVLDKLLEAIVFADNALTHLIVDGASVYKPHLLAKVIIDRRVSVLLINVAVATTVIRGSPSANGAAACEAPSVLTVSKMTEVVALQELIVDPIDPLNCWEGTPKSGLNLSYVTFSPVSPKLRNRRYTDKKINKFTPPEGDTQG